MANMTRAERVRRADPNRHFLTHLAVMPAWHKAVIALAMLLGIAGLTGHLMAKSGNGDTNHAQNSSASSSGFASQQQIDSLSKYSPIAMTIGVAVLAGFTFGWFFRAFLAPAVVAAVLIAGGIGALAHFGYVHPEAWLPHASAKGGNSSADPTGGTWLTQYAMHVKNLVMGHVATTSTGFVAACLGFRRW
jgi:hypothetical protein